MLEPPDLLPLDLLEEDFDEDVLEAPLDRVPLDLVLPFAFELLFEVREEEELFCLVLLDFEALELAFLVAVGFEERPVVAFVDLP